MSNEYDEYITVGSFYIERCEDDKFWLEKTENNEGDYFPLSKLEEIIANFYKENVK